MQNQLSKSENDPASVAHHCEALPPDVLTAKLESLKGDLKAELVDSFRTQARLLLDEYSTMKPLLSMEDLARTLGKSSRSCETMLAASELPPPLWIGGVRRWHPDTIHAYLRSRETTSRKQQRRAER